MAKSSPTGINTGSGSLTVAGWVNLKDPNLGTFCELHVNSTQSRAFVLGLAGGACYLFSDRFNVSNNKTISQALFNFTVNTNRDVYMIYTMTANRISVYANGTSILSNSAFAVAMNTGAYSNLFFGKGQDTTQADVQFLNASIKDTLIINDELTSTKASALYYSAVRNASLASQWVMEEGSGTSIADSVGSNTLTATSIIWSSIVPTQARTLASARTLGSARTLASTRTLA